MLNAPVTDGTRRVSAWRLDLLLAVTITLLAAPLAHIWSAQPASRYLLTVAVVDDHAVEIDPYESYLGVDYATFDGHVYSDKAPYQPVLAAIPYQVYRALGGDPFPPGGPVGRDSGLNVGLWWVTFWSCTLPAMAIAILTRRLVAKVHPEVATRVAIGLSLGTLLLPFAAILFGHVAAALCVAVAWYLVRSPVASDRATLGAGVALGIGVGIDFSVAALALIIFVAVALRRHWRNVMLLAVGAAVLSLPILLYNWLVYENPLTVSYQGHMPNFSGGGAMGVYNMQAPEMGELLRVFVGDRGIFFLTPIVLLAVVGCFWILASMRTTRTDAAVALASFVAMAVFSSAITAYGHDSPGPRYLVPVLPLLALPLAEAWRRVPLICALATGVGVFTMTLAMTTDPTPGAGDHNAVGRWITQFFGGNYAPSLWSAIGPDPLLLVSLVAGFLSLAALILTDRVARREPISPQPAPLSA